MYNFIFSEWLFKKYLALIIQVLEEEDNPHPRNVEKKKKNWIKSLESA